MSTNDTSNDWPARLKAWRVAQGNVSMEAGARRAGVSLNAWGKWERGRARPSGLAVAALEILLRSGKDGAK